MNSSNKFTLPTSFCKVLCDLTLVCLSHFLSFHSPPCSMLFTHIKFLFFPQTSWAYLCSRAFAVTLPTAWKACRLPFLGKARSFIIGSNVPSQRGVVQLRHSHFFSRLCFIFLYYYLKLSLLIRLIYPPKSIISSKEGTFFFFIVVPQCLEQCLTQ